MPLASSVVVLTAVLPAYRSEFLRLLREEAPSVQWFAGPEHCDASVRTDVPQDLYNPVTNVFLLGRRAYVQVGATRQAVQAPVAVVDLNPRSISAWLVLLARKVLGKRTLVWGHLHPRAGATGRTARVRTGMRRFSDGMITYTLTDRERLQSDRHPQPAWAATNALYTRQQLRSVRPGRSGTEVLYVGRLVAEKKVALLVRAFAAASPDLPATARLTLIGHGVAQDALRELAEHLGVGDKVLLPGAAYDFATLAARYERAQVSVSPGYIGLSLTQSLGFGVPVLIPRGERHAPEVELAEDEPLVGWFEKDDQVSLAAALVEAYARPVSRSASTAARTKVEATYSADSMVSGFIQATMGAR